MTGRADYLSLGDYNCICYECGRKRKASTMKKHWQGYYVCPEHWEPRQTQDFVRAVPDNMTPPWTQPMPADTYLDFEGEYVVMENPYTCVTDTEALDGAYVVFLTEHTEYVVTETLDSTCNALIVESSVPALGFYGYIVTESLIEIV